jgi:DNA-binding CsgD family transcriptional regulator
MRLLHDASLLSDTVGAIYECVLRPEGWQPMLVTLAEMLGAGSGFLGVTTARAMSGPLFTLGLPSHEEVERHAPYNPLLPIMATLAPCRSFVVSRDYGLDQLRRTRFHRAYLGPRGDLDAIWFVLSTEGDEFGQLGLITQSGRPPITPEEAAGLELIVPHLRRAFELSGLLGRTQLAAATYATALDQLDAPVLILDATRRIDFANARAAQEMEAGRVFHLRGGALQGATDEVEALLRRLAQGPGHAFEGMIATTKGGERLLFAVALDGQGAERRLLLVLRDPRQDTRNPIAIAARSFGLTAAQVQVLAFLAQGNTPEEIADILGLSMATVRSHLSALFHRTGTARQAELVARTLSLASPLRQDSPGAG